MNKVSVIITTYNSESTIHNTLSSILNQDGINEKFELEIIVIDDCSTDNTYEIVKEYDDVIFLSTGKNSGGPNKGRNIGLETSSGDYICITDHDDEWHSDRIKNVLPQLIKVPIVSSGYTLFDRTDNKKIERVKDSNEPYIYYEKDVTFIKCLSKSRKGQSVYLGSLIFRKELAHIQFEEQYGVVDFDWLVRLFQGQDSIEICQSLYTRLVDGGNLSLDKTYRERDFEYSLLFLKTYENEYPYEVREAIQRINGSRARYFYLIGDMKNARFYFRKSSKTVKTLAYYFTTYIGSKLVKRLFKVFG